MDIAKAIPLDMTLVETDLPFLSPMPFRGKRNEPARTRLVAVQLAEVTSKNARSLFNLNT